MDHGSGRGGGDGARDGHGDGGPAGGHRGALRHRREDAAAALLADLPRPAPDLAARVAALRAERSREHERRAALEQLHHDTDLNVHRRARVALVLGLSVLWGIWSLIAGHLFRAGILTLDWSTHAKVGAAFGGLLGAGAWVFRKTLLRTRVNRRVFQNLAALLASAAVLMVLAARLDLPPESARTLIFAVLVYFVLSNAFSVDRRQLLSGIGILVVVGVPIALFPDYALDLQGLFGALLGGQAAWLWGRPTRDPAAPGPSELPIAHS